MNGELVSAEHVPAGVVIGAWSKIGADGLVVVPVGAAQGVCVTAVESLGSTVSLPDAHAYVLTEEASTRYGVPRVLVPRRCCGWDWVGAREAYMRARTVIQPCVVWHTPPHEEMWEFLELPGADHSWWEEREAARVAAAERGWLAVASALGEPEK